MLKKFYDPAPVFCGTRFASGQPFVVAKPTPIAIFTSVVAAKSKTIRCNTRTGRATRLCSPFIYIKKSPLLAL